MRKKWQETDCVRKANQVEFRIQIMPSPMLNNNNTDDTSSDANQTVVGILHSTNNNNYDNKLIWGGTIHGRIN